MPQSNLWHFTIFNQLLLRMDMVYSHCNDMAKYLIMQQKIMTNLHVS
jgi:hypothetical protein